MNIYFNNSATGEKIDSSNKPTCEEALGLLRRLTAPKSTLIMQLPSGIGLDFYALDVGLLEVEFYGNDMSNASVTRETAEQIIKRAFEGRQGRTKDIYADLISEWNF